MSFRKVILREVRRQGLSGYRLAKMTGLSDRGVQMYLASDRDMTGERLSLIAAALGLELAPRRGSRRKDR